MKLQTFDPAGQQQPAHALTLLIRGLRAGERVELADGQVVRSITVVRGAKQERRFAVLPSDTKSTPLQRHRTMKLGHNVCRTAEQAANQALGIDTN